MGGNEKGVQLKVFVDKKKKKVMFAEAENDFVEILFSFLTLPLGTIARLLNKNPNSKDAKLGSLTSLHQSVENLDIKHFSKEHCKVLLTYPYSSSFSICQKLKINLNEEKQVDGNNNGDLVFIGKKASFIITDDLKVIPIMLDSSIKLLNSLGIKYIDLLEMKTVDFGFEEFSNLLKWSLVSNNPLTNIVLGGNKPCSCLGLSCIQKLVLTNSRLFPGYTNKPQKVKLLVQKSTKHVLCAQVDNFFVELLFSFLTIPLGAVKRLTMGNSSSVAIDNVYNSVSSLGDEKYLISDEIKAVLLSPKLATNYYHVTDLLPIYEQNIKSGSFLKEQETFIVSDDLKVTLSTDISPILKFNTLGVPIGDIEVMEVSIGEQEALLLLETSLNSTSALTDCLDGLKKTKVSV